MTRVALVLGNSTYKELGDLPCCTEDVLAIHALLDASGKYDEIVDICNATADVAKSLIRDKLPSNPKVDEVFFYFSGHGVATESDFFYCCTDFISSRPNETGLADSFLHDLLRSASPDLVVKVIDACNSGVIQVKDGAGSILFAKRPGINNLVQLASCLDSQSSLTGEPISKFTEAFCSAALRRDSGPVYYSDIASTLRDDFLSNDSQTPHFVSQGTGRETLVDDAACLEGFREKFYDKWSLDWVEDEDAEQEVEEEAAASELLARLQEADKHLPSYETVASYIGGFFSAVRSEVEKNSLPDFFDVAINESPKLESYTSKPFIIRSLSGEKRQDEFVTAYLRKAPQSGVLGSIGALSAFGALSTGEDYVSNGVLQINLKLESAQLTIDFTPKFRSLKRIHLVISCAPSLSCCYVFEHALQYAMTDFSSYSGAGTEIVRRWYRMSWSDSSASLANAIALRIKAAADAQLEEASQRLKE